MRLRIGDESANACTVDGGGDLTGLFADWIAKDRAVGRYVTVTRERSGLTDGGMSGGLLEWIGLSLSAGFSTAGLIYSHLNFRASLPPRRRPGARLVVEHNGVRMVIEDGSPEDAARLARLLSATRDCESDTPTRHSVLGDEDSSRRSTRDDRGASGAT
ncbi:hypothetical protein DTL70_05525 [Streptomyces diacarni]|uniref:Uncharacterized protein n=1 Tax=Streptomyces diacarni TaxID=2800381 RepID=A0A367FB28_9ACTN|nr:hypothetical protein [Streptomyces diacarni]RCG27149.1 hypothetical protein DTL70_05525 [Streptomyces diacarni]